MTTAAYVDAASSTLPTEQRLLLAAERLFAERGIEAVSLRSIMQAAETNVAAVHYHYGSKDLLVEAVVLSRVHVIAEARARMLEQLDRATASSPTSLAAAFVQPVIDLINSGAADWVRVMARMLAVNHPALAVVTQEFLEQNRQFLTLVCHVDPAAPVASVRFRLMQAMRMTLNVLGDIGTVRDVMALGGDTWTDEEVIEQLLSLVTALIAGPTCP